ncbi:exonuclease [Aeromonas phage BUCT695]|uniref:exonuclease n=1 Tax=Aeromonas phage BUCT695 TaxID=2908630 RepID=UPI00232987DD|nr:exonuclease [Aeromonas phage BUCT695]UIW10565.1 5'-3' exonuclease [Aeromonas phage BUCT695]
MSEKKLRALLDADILRYQFGAVKSAHPFLEGEYIPALSTEVIKLVDDLIAHVLEITGATDYICVLSGEGNFRHDVAKQIEYKGNRDPNSTRPYHYDTVGNHIMDNHPALMVSGIEADDWLAIEQRKGGNTIICSRDKDLETVHGLHCRWSCGANQPERVNYYITEFDAVKFFFKQMLTGDNTDNIIGCGKRELVKWGKNPDGTPKMMMRRKGVGDKTAVKLLQDAKTSQELFDIVKAQYEELFGKEYEDIMLENARLLYVGQMPDNLFNWDWLNYELTIEGSN